MPHALRITLLSTQHTKYTAGSLLRHSGRACPVLDTGAVGRDPESTPPPLDSGFRRNDGLLRESGTVKSLQQNPLRNYDAQY
jgi:hypothetical protein